MSDSPDFLALIEFAKWKRAHPDEYKEVMEEIGNIMKDLNDIMQKAMRG